MPINQPTIQEPRQSWLAAANAVFKITPVEPVWCVHSADPRCPRPDYASRPSWLQASVEIAKQRQLIATLIHENELLRQRLGDRTDFVLSADSTPALSRKAG